MRVEESVPWGKAGIYYRDMDSGVSQNENILSELVVFTKYIIFVILNEMKDLLFFNCIYLWR